MEPIALADAARTVLTYISPLIAAGALAKIGEETTDTSLTLLDRAWTTLTQRFHGHKKAEAALTLYEDELANPALQQQVEQRIVEVFRNEPTAAQELLALAQVIAAQSPSAAPPRQHNQTVGGNANVGTAIAGDLHGNLTIGAIDFSRNKSAPTPPSAATPSPVERASRVTRHASRVTAVNPQRRRRQPSAPTAYISPPATP